MTIELERYKDTIKTLQHKVHDQQHQIKQITLKFEISQEKELSNKTKQRLQLLESPPSMPAKPLLHPRPSSPPHTSFSSYPTNPSPSSPKSTPSSPIHPTSKAKLYYSDDDMIESYRDSNRRNRPLTRMNQTMNQNKREITTRKGVEEGEEDRMFMQWQRPITPSTPSSLRHVMISKTNKTSSNHSNNNINTNYNNNEEEEKHFQSNNHENNHEIIQDKEESLDKTIQNTPRVNQLRQIAANKLSNHSTNDGIAMFSKSQSNLNNNHNNHNNLYSIDEEKKLLRMQEIYSKLSCK